VIVQHAFRGDAKRRSNTARPTDEKNPGPVREFRTETVLVPLTGMPVCHRRSAVAHE